MKFLNLRFLPVVLALLLQLPVSETFAQHVPVHISNQGIYHFLDEAASEQFIDLYSLVKPYSRQEIARLLNEAEDARPNMTKRQEAELDFYLREYARELSPPDSAGSSWLWQKKQGNKRFDVFYYSDSLFRMTVNPIIGSDVWVNENGSFSHWWNGIETRASIGKFGLWASLRDNHESTQLTAPDFQNDRIGAANIKTYSGGNRDYWEVRAGISYAWKWGHVGLIMGQFEWGENNAGANIHAGRTPAFPRLELDLNPAPWFRMTYIHGSLISEVVDSSLSFTTSTAYGTDYREVYHSKFLAANIFSFTPTSGLQLSIGNSVIYDYRYPSVAFLLPVAFYKAIDHTMSSGINNMNSQLFFSASSRNLKHFHFYGTVFLDEVAMDRVFNDEEFNFVSYKAGFSSTILPNFRFLSEYTWTNCLTFRHDVPTTTYESNRYNMGHYLEDNAKNFYAALEWSPWRTLLLKAYMNLSSKGPDNTELGTMPRAEIPAFDPIVWESKSYGLLATVQLVNDLSLRLGYEWRNVSGEQAYLDRWTASVYHGSTSSFRFGINYGF